MVARKYVLVDGAKVNGFKGQAKIVMDALVELKDSGPRFASEVNEIARETLVTTQDTLRVTLYYIIIFKGKGLVRAVEATEVEPVNAFAGDCGDCD